MLVLAQQQQQQQQQYTWTSAHFSGWQTPLMAGVRRGWRWRSSGALVSPASRSDIAQRVDVLI